ncbi:MAG: phosphate ABC transporter ATP-binding protein [Planctomycetota bacterium]|nr:phosphate ABC transporter ATP-binding protein [Planctomycetota bacterium]
MSGTDGSTFLRMENLGLAYHGKPALEGVDLEIRRGAITALIGPSGCGKTSLLTCVNRLIDLVPGARAKGKVEFQGRDVLDPRADLFALRKRIGMLFQRPNPFPLSIRRNLELPLREHGLRDRAELAATVERTLRDVALWDEVKDRLEKPALALSGGQQQRLCLARALALEPEAMLMDEPCSALDPLASGAVEDLIVSLRGRVTVLIVTHNLAQARRIADDVALLWLQDGVGRLIERGPAAAFFAQPKEEITRAYLSGERG